MFHILLVCFSEVIKIWIHSKQEISSLHYANLRLTHEELQIYNSFLHLTGCNKYDFFFFFYWSMAKKITRIIVFLKSLIHRTLQQAFGYVQHSVHRIVSESSLGLLTVNMKYISNRLLIQQIHRP